MNAFDDIVFNLLRKISREMEAYFNNTSSDETTHPYHIYEFIKGRELLSGKFLSEGHFYHILKDAYNLDSKAFRQIIPCDVDTSDPKRYSWKFYRKEKKISNEVNAKSVITRSNHHREGRNIPTNNRDLVRSKHEEYLYNRLLNEAHFEVYYELKFEDGFKLPDFTIKNTKTEKTYLWEHFGMLKKLSYAAKVDEKIQWYKDKEFEFIQDGGSLIITIYRNKNEFIKEVERMICLINKL